MKLSSGKLLSASVLVLSGFIAGQAHAGFEWIPPAEPEIIMTPPPAIVDAPVIAPLPVAPIVQAVPDSPAQQAPSFQPIPMHKPAAIDNQPINAPIPLAAVSPTPVAPLSQPQPLVFDGAFVETPNAAPLPAPSETVTAPAQSAPKGYQSPLRDRIVVAQDAPIKVESNFNNAERLSISPYPSAEDLRVTEMVPFTAPHVSTTPVARAQNFTVIEGFGRDVPLALALSQIVPADYAYNFMGNVNPGFRISWSGGQPWNQVLSDALTPLGYGVFISGNTVTIGAFPG